MTPLIEIPAKRPPPADRPWHIAPRARTKPRADWLSEMAASLKHDWSPYLPAFVEVRGGVKGLLPTLGIANRTERFFEDARHHGLKLVPVARLGYGPRRCEALSRIVAADQRGVCVRITRANLQDPRFTRRVSRLLHAIGTTLSGSDLVLDLHVVDTSEIDYMILCAQIPAIQHWRTFSIVGGAFPAGLGKYARGSNAIPRTEWQVWSREISRDLPRKPTYGDYATQHPVPFNPKVHPTPCANIRYTIDQDWIVIKGYQLGSRKNEADPSTHEQFPVMARLITQRPYYKSDAFSAGDKYIQLMAEKAREGTASGPGNTGGSTSWLTAAVNHHLTFVTVQIATLCASLGSPSHEPGGGEAAPPQIGASKDLSVPSHSNLVLAQVVPTE
jgi:hypothetical protein